MDRGSPSSHTSTLANNVGSIPSTRCADVAAPHEDVRSPETRRFYESEGRMSSLVSLLPVVLPLQALRDPQKRPIIDTNIKPDGVVYHHGMYVSLTSVKLLIEAKTSAAEASSSYESLGSDRPLC
ncbi:hypothetical protein GGF46_001945 [Coemansia sp. RSA 552]|nr:hypothetical protein GGF46_001945 [Coemansia sp. RSA 552]